MDRCWFGVVLAIAGAVCGCSPALQPPTGEALQGPAATTPATVSSPTVSPRTDMPASTAVRPDPTPSATPPPAPLASPLGLACTEGGSPLPAPDGLDASFNPLPGSLAIGQRVDALPLLARASMRKLQGDVPGPAGSTYAAYQIGDTRIDLMTTGGDVTLVAGALITAAAGMSPETARAWLAALAPCAPLPPASQLSGDSQNDNGDWFTQIDPPRVDIPLSGLFADFISLTAVHQNDALWQGEVNFFYSRKGGYEFRDPASVPSAPPLPNGRIYGVSAIAGQLGK